MTTVVSTEAEASSNVKYAVAAGFLGWTLDAFDFFVLIFVLSAVAKEFGRSIPAIALTITASLAMRPIGAFVFGLMADRFGRRRVLMANILFYSTMEVLSGLVHSYDAFFALRLLYGIGMGGNWGVGASLAMESAPPKWRGILSGMLQQGYSLGNILAAFAYFFIFPHWGWRSMFIIGAVPAIMTLLVCARVEEPKAWQEARTDWTTYRSSIFSNYKLFLYLILLMAMMNFMSHGSQDLYPTFLQKQRGFGVDATAIITAISMVGAIIGGLTFGHLSDRLGRRRSMVTAALLGLIAIPLWILAPNKPLLAVGAFAMQFMVQGAWGVIPAHINELSPKNLRGFFPGLAYQLGVLIASTISYVEAVFAEHLSYSTSMGILAVTVLILGAVVIWAGPEAKGIAFSNSLPTPRQPQSPSNEPNDDNI
jgi:SHS family lactate transporter-like MFS transporter